MKDKQVSVRLSLPLWDALQRQAEREITDPPRRPGPTGKTAELIRKLILEGAKKRKMGVTDET